MLETNAKVDCKTVRNQRIRYLIGLSAIALLITASFILLQPSSELTEAMVM